MTSRDSPAILVAERSEAAAERIEVLPHQHRRRRDQRDLTAAEHRRRGGAQRHLGLAEPDIAADQPVHRMPRFQVGQDVRDGARLIDGRHEREPGDEALVAPGGRVQLRRLPGLALARQATQAPRGLGDVVFDLRAALFPALAVEPVERHRFALGAIAPDLLDLADRHHQHGAAGILDAQRLLFRDAGRRDTLDAAQPSDAVLDMDHRVADPQRAFRARFERAARQLHRHPVAGAAAEQV